MRRASAAALADLNMRLEPLTIRHIDASVMILIAANSGITLSDIGRALDIQRANMTPLIARLEDRGLLSRIPLDGRSQGLETTALGEDFVTQIHEAVAEHEATLIEKIPSHLRTAFAQALTALWAST
jgi:DNA-binding MarR family transcriptional regulator